MPLPNTFSANLRFHSFFQRTPSKWAIQPDTLTIHADRGAPMTSKAVAQLLEDLGVSKSHSRPYTSNDNPFSEAQFKTMKYRPDYPDRFADMTQARSWAVPFFAWYNNDYRHTALGLMTPQMVHFGHDAQVTQQRAKVLQAAYECHPERFVKGIPQPPLLPKTVWINPPRPDAELSIPAGLVAGDAVQPDHHADPDNLNAARTEIREAVPTLSFFQESCASNSARPTSLSAYPSTPTALEVTLVDIRQHPAALLPRDAQ